MSLTLLQPFNINTNAVFAFSNTNIKITGGTSGQALVTDGAGNLSFATATGGGGGGAETFVYGNTI